MTKDTGKGKQVIDKRNGQQNRYPQREMKGALAPVGALKLLASICLTCVWICMMHAAPIEGIRASDEEAARVGVRGTRPVTVADAIRMTKLGNPDYYAGGSAAGRVATFSPDGKKFVVVLRKGNLEENTTEYSLLLWNADQLYESPSPQMLLRMASSSNREAIAAISWLPDNETITFLGEHTHELRQLYAFNTRTRRLRRMTNHATNVLSYSITSKGDQIAYFAEEPVQELVDERARRNGVLVTTQRLKDLIRGQKGARFDSNIGRNHLYIQRRGATTSLATIYGTAGNPPFLSPDGRYVVMLNQVLQCPKDWREYEDPYLREWTSVKFSNQEGYSAIGRYELIDTLTRHAQILLNAPAGRSDIAWSPDSRSVLIANTYLPLETTEGEERTARQTTRFMVEVKVPTGEFTKISSGDCRIVSWDSKTNRLVVETANSKEGAAEQRWVFVRKRGGIWERVNSTSGERILPEIVLEEDMNTPPKIFAINHSDSKEKILLYDLNPQFKGLKLARVEEVQWRDSDGHEVKGGLYYPIDYVPGKRYPVVIQTHLWNPTKFWIDGPWTTAFAAQPMAGKDIMVLQADENVSEDLDTPREFPRELSSLESAIDCLDRKGLIDRNRVGIIGFSRSGSLVSYALTHSKFHFAAAAVADGSDLGYFNYLILANLGVGRELEFINGGPPFGDGLNSWITRSPGFNLDKIQTPVRLLALGPDILVGAEWGWFAGSFRLGKPIEMVYLPEAVHVLQKPWERMVSQQGNVDWFVFWLKGEEDPDPSKREQYSRWHELRDQKVDSTEK